MQFQDSGLPKDKLIETAFDYSRNFTLRARKMALLDFNRQMDEIHATNMLTLDADRAAGKIQEAEYKLNKTMLEKMHDDHLKQGPMLVEQALDGMFVARRVNPALEMAKNSETPESEMIAATLLCECIKSPKDYKTITDKFGARVADLAAEIAHIDAYPDEREKNLAEASSDAKRVYLAWLDASVNNIAEQITQAAQANPPQKLQLPPGHEKQMYTDVTQLWGVDKKLDARFVDAFNRVCEAAGSPFRVEVDDKGALTLVNGALAPAIKGEPSKPKGPKGPGGGGIGGDVF
jgi:hypothetical protein